MTKDQKIAEANRLFKRQKHLISRYFTLKGRDDYAGVKRLLAVILEARQIEVRKCIIIAMPIPKFQIGSPLFDKIDYKKKYEPKK